MKHILLLLLAASLAACHKDSGDAAPIKTSTTPGSTSVAPTQSYPASNRYHGTMHVSWIADYPVDSFDTSYLASIQVGLADSNRVYFPFRYWRRLQGGTQVVLLDRSAGFEKNAQGIYENDFGKSMTVFTIRNDSLIIRDKIYNKTFLMEAVFSGNKY